MDSNVSLLLQTYTQTLTQPDAAFDLTALFDDQIWSELPRDAWLELLQQLTKAELPNTPAAVRWINQCMDRAVATGSEQGWHADAAFTRALVELYQHLGGTSTSSEVILQWLAVSPLPGAVELLTEMLVKQPPATAEQVARALQPLFRPDANVEAMFPQLLDAISHPQAAACVIDFANYLVREQRVPAHPAVDRLPRLLELLGSVTQHLAVMEETAMDPDIPLDQLRDQVNESAALLVSLCDCCALIGDPAATGKLRQAMELGHRRIRTEAAAALCRLGDEDGKSILLEMAQEPITRLRVLNYAAELGVLDEVDEQFTTEVAQAESRLALTLSQPNNVGFPPVATELIDQRELFWPGFDESVVCYLFKYTYQLAESEQSNIGIVGPVTHAMAADLNDLTPEDIYAAYAGWQAEHEEIYEWEAHSLPVGQQPELSRLERRLHDEGFESLEPALLAVFFGQRLLVARCYRGGQPGVAVGDGVQCLWFPRTSARIPIGPEEAYSIYKGRQLLRSFND